MLRRATPTPPVAAAGLLAVLRRELRLGDPGSLRAHLIRGAGGSFALKVASTLLSVAIGVVLARSLGASHYGIYALAFAWLELLKVPTALGLPALVTREVAVYRARQDWARLRGLLLRANQAVLGMSLLLMLLAGGTSWLLAARFEDPHALTTFWLALLLLPLLGLTAIRSACLCGLHRVVLAQVPEALVRPVLFLALIGAVWLLGGRSPTPELAMSLQVIAVGCAFALGAVWLLRSLPRDVKSAAPAYDTRAWTGSALSFLFMDGLTLINTQTDIIMLGWFTTSADVGVYRVAGVSAGLVIFAFGAVHAVLAPNVARLYAEGDTPRLQRAITRSARVILLFSLPASLALVFFATPLLSSIFGPEYAVGATALMILALAQLANAGMGLAHLLLNMTGHERDTAKATALSALGNLGLNALFIPLWGINGAALASAVSLVVWNVLLTTLAYRRLGLHTTALGSVRYGRAAAATSYSPTKQTNSSG